MSIHHKLNNNLDIDINALYQTYNYSINKIVDLINSLKNNKIKSNVLKSFINIDYKLTIAENLKKSLNSFLNKASLRDSQVIKQIVMSMPDNIQVVFAISNLLEKKIYEQKSKQTKRLDLIIAELNQMNVNGEQVFNEILELKIKGIKDLLIIQKFAHISSDLVKQMIVVSNQTTQDNFAYLIKNKIGLYQGIGAIGSFILNKGFRINQIIENSEAENMGLNCNDVIIKVNDKFINELSRKQAIALLASPLILQVIRNGVEIEIKSAKIIKTIIDSKMNEIFEQNNELGLEKVNSITNDQFFDKLNNEAFTDEKTEELAEV